MYNSIPHAIKANADKIPDKTVIIDKFGEISYKDYFSLIEKTAVFFKNYGINFGDKVVLVARQDRKFLSVFHALQIIGAIPLPMERSTKNERVEELYNLTFAKVCISSSDIPNVNSLKYEDIVFDNYTDTIKITLNDVAEILFTTGTTGKSKGVVMSHIADVAVAENVCFGVEMKRENVEIIPMPLNHAFALRRYYSNIINGSTVVLLDGVINMKLLFDSVEKYGVTAMAMNPAALGILLKMASKQLSAIAYKIDYLQFGSAHLPDEDKLKIKKLLPNARLYDLYGSTESGCTCISEFSSNELENCIGKPTAHADFKIIDENNNPLPPNEKGRLICGGEMNMTEYYNSPELTAETLVDGYVYSNDLCTMDEEGRIYYFGRCDDVITTGGNKISPQEVEDMAITYKGIDDCALIGVPDAILGSAPKLFVVPNNLYNEDELIKHISQKAEYYMIPKSVEIIDKIPKTFNGKPKRKELRKEK